MGIQGLLPLLKDIQVTTSISSYSGLTVGIDVYCWLHKGAYGCASELVLGKPTKVHVNYVMRRIDMLISHNVTPILVFDGGRLPAKAETEKSRRSKKKQHHAAGMAALKEGNNKVAYENFQRCVDITPEMASEVIQECFAINVQCIVAPYEADAQLAYLMKEGITQLTISEDSDLLLYGCNRVMYKMSIEGDGLVIDLDNLSNVQTVQLASFTREKFRHMCMLSGCDYLPSIKGMGLMKAFKAIRRFTNVFQCLKALKCNPSYSVPKDYEENFRKADLVFKYQLVVDIRTKRLVRLSDLDDLDKFGDAEKDFAGPQIDDNVGIQIALGNIDPISGKTLACLENFASGVITDKAQKSGGWDSSQTNTSTAFVFRDKSQNSVTNSIPTSSLNSIRTNSQTNNKLGETVVVSNSEAPSPLVDASKSLKRLHDGDVSTPTREEKIRKLYKEGVPEEEEQHATDNLDTIEIVEAQAVVSENQNSVQRKHHNVFAKKSSMFKRSFKQQLGNGSEVPQRTVASKFFVNKIANEKENYVLQADTPPEKVQINDTPPAKEKINESSKTIHHSFIDYLDKTNVRGYEVNRPLLLSQDSPKSVVKKSKRKNIFAVKTEATADSAVLRSSPKKPLGDSTIDFNVEISLDQCAVGDAEISCPKDELKTNNTKVCKIRNILSHFQAKPVASIYQTVPNRKGDCLTISEDNKMKIRKQCNSALCLDEKESRPKSMEGTETKIDIREHSEKNIEADLLDDEGDDHLFDIEAVLDTRRNGNVELDEEPLPLHLEQKPKFQSKETIELDGVDESADAIYLEKESKPCCTEDDQDLTLVQSLMFPTKAKGKQCRPIGLSRKHKSVNRTDSKFKQITFEKFAFKRKSVC